MVRVLRMPSLLMMLCFLAMACLLPSCHTLRKNETPNRALAETFEYVVDNSPEKNLSCGEIFATIRGSRPPPESITQIIGLLHAKRPGFFKNYTLMPYSESLH